MKFYRIFALLALAGFIGLALVNGAVQSASGVSSSAFQPWQKQTFQTNLDYHTLSTALGGPKEYTLISYTTFNPPHIHLNMPAISISGNCGPGNTWRCDGLLPPGVTVQYDTVSPVATHTLINTFFVGWAYRYNPNHIYAYIREYSADLQLIGTPQNIHLMDTGIGNYPNTILVGRPSLALDSSGRPHVALVLHNYDVNEDYVVYIHYNGVSNTSCGFSSFYQCDKIQTLHGIAGTPLIGMTNGQSPRIVYYEAINDFLHYSYPAVGPENYLACGPGGTWRCAVVENSAYGDLFPTPAMAENPLSLFPAHPFTLAYAFTVNATNEHQLIQAEYVYSGGNCGIDSDGIYRWRCTWVTSWATGAAPTYIGLSIQVDERGYPVIAYNSEGGISYNLSLAYPAARIGQTSGNCRAGSTWQCQKIDGAGINTGRDVSLQLNSVGLGFAAYIVDQEYSPDLHIAQQYVKLFIPVVRK